MLTNAQSNAINNAAKNAANTLYSISNADIDVAIAEFEDATNVSNGEDIGGLVVYFKNKKLVAFYDYELEEGAVFAVAV